MSEPTTAPVRASDLAPGDVVINRLSPPTAYPMPRVVASKSGGEHVAIVEYAGGKRTHFYSPADVFEVRRPS